MNYTTQAVLDKFAISISALCAIHCALTPVLLALMPSLSALGLADHLYHEMMVLIVLPTSMLAVLLGCNKHKDMRVLVLAVIGLLTLAGSAIFGHDFLGETGEKAATMIGAIIIALAHWRNLGLCRKQACAEK
ncbi:MerC domain-containing protein [Shewanella sp. Scap07]|uniref:MerC domain-containing protein n=1 Tax=Shewanella sp. Scap07 TaxID=2589987 RepID=UPI0015BF30CA|nr:MerC domain-containing protein [Shewanella sp. Scap07]